MIFTSVQYLGFFAIILFLLRVIPVNKYKKMLLLGASYLFYSFWDYRFVALIVAMTLINHAASAIISRSDDNRVRKLWLAISVIANLSVLGFFKYYNFFVESANVFLDQWGLGFPLLDIILPVGISFVTFEVMSYTIDIYRKEIKSHSFWDFSLLVVFFPHLVAGPILKPRLFLPQLEKDIVIRRDNVVSGMQIFIFGVVKKVVIADNIAHFVDPVFADPGMYDSLTVWCAVLGYAVQIYCDFSGYSDMAIGSARCMGLTIPRNFNMPYLSLNVTEFWRRWHISLSTWLREYLYFSLGGNRKGKLRQYINLTIVMLLGGLWHGASWNFVVWGLLHGIGLAVHKAYFDFVLKKKAVASRVYRFCSWLVTLVFVCFTWVFFRSPSFATSGEILAKMFSFGSPGVFWFYPLWGVCLALVIAAHFAGMKLSDYPQVDVRSFRGLFIIFFVLLGILFLMPVNSSPFIYFQF